MDIELLNAICPPFKESEDENDDDPEVDAAKPSPKYEAAKYKAELSTIGWTICNCDYQADTREISKKLKAKVDKGTLNDDTRNWLMDMEPGPDIRAIDDNRIREHLKTVKDPNFSAIEYSQKGYVLRGGTTTDGQRLNLEAYKLKELHAARYKRLTPDKLPPRLTSTVAGTSDYLTEIRNIIKSTEDIKRLWNCHPNDVKTVGLDLGQAYVVGVNALLPRATY
ncbi:hypothetical protein B0O80DRAFT_422551 [Mortierella sp. GBAus27b]|nr:hypothetical protein B0O80DRAFT_422551 [Mortierella sp. GBAus27b]